MRSWGWWLAVDVEMIHGNWNAGRLLADWMATSDDCL